MLIAHIAPKPAFLVTGYARAAAVYRPAKASFAYTALINGLAIARYTQQVPRTAFAARRYYVTAQGFNFIATKTNYTAQGCGFYVWSF